MTFFYLISNRISGQDLGIYVAKDEDDALDIMARDAGYADYGDLLDTCGGKESELIIEPVDDPDDYPHVNVIDSTRVGSQ